MLIPLFLLITVDTQFEDLNALDNRIQTEVGTDAEPVDKRLKIAQCPADPIIAPAVDKAVVVRCPALGWRLRVPVRESSSSAQAEKYVIRKGDLVECISGGPGFSVSTRMIALDNAAAGQPLRVKSPTSPVPLTAIAKSRGLASF